MKLRIISLMLILAATIITARGYEPDDYKSYDFESNGLFFKINADGTSVTVTYEDINFTPTYPSLSGSLVIPATVRGYTVSAIASSAFSNCVGITSVSIPNSVSRIGNGAFYHCTGLTSIELPNSITSISSNLFSGCSALTSIEIPNSVTSIEYFAFSGCTGFKSIEIPTSVTSIGVSAFSGCSGLTSIEIPTSVTSIGDATFSGCIGLISIEIPASVTSIGGFAFRDCIGLSEISIPRNTAEIGNGITSGCTGLVSLKVDGGNSNYDSRDNCNAIIETTTNALIAGCQNTIVPEGIESIANSAFSGSKITSVTIPKSVTSIGENVFAGCSYLASVKWNIKTYADFSLGGSPFDGLQSISSFEFGDEVEKIPSHICKGLTGLTTVTLRGAVKTIGSYAFFDCGALTAVTLPNSVKTIGAAAFSGCSAIESVVIPNSVTSLGLSVFSGCTGLKSATISASLKSLASNLFRHCSSLTSVIIPNSVTTIGPYAFAECSSLSSVTMGSAVAAIGVSSFWGCAALKSIVLPNSVTSVGNSAFSGCVNLSAVEWNVQSGSDYTADTFPFKGDENITSFLFGDEVAKVPAYLCYNLTGLKSIIIPSALSAIGASVFNGCRGMRTLTIGKGVTSIGANAFQNCEVLTTINSYPDAADVTLGAAVFEGVPQNRCALHVRSSCLDSYISTAQWLNFINIVGDLPDDAPVGNRFAVEPEIAIVQPGDTFRLSVTTKGGEAFSVYSDNPEIASVSYDGTVTVNSIGVVAIRVTTQSGDSTFCAVVSQVPGDLNGDSDVDGVDASIVLEKVLSGK